MVLDPALWPGYFLNASHEAFFKLNDFNTMAAEFPIRAVVDDRGIDVLITHLTKVARAAKVSEKEIEEMNAELRKTGQAGTEATNQVNKGLNNLASDGLKKVGQAFVVAFAIDRLVAYGKEVVKITGEYEKFEAVLANTLGSKGAARGILNEIVAFAAKTPFSVRELTESFIKLANRGVKPTMEQMRSLGDLSATLGKPVEQLVEALLDVNNTERWNEIGVKAKTVGDNVQLSFRGITMEVDRTTAGVTEAAVALGKMEGVAGSMQDISETLAGSISNMGDNLETFANNLGKYNRGPIGAFFTIINEGLSAMNEHMQTANMTAIDFAEIGLKRFRDKFDEITKAFKDTGDAGDLNIFFQDLTIAINSTNADLATTEKRLKEINEVGIRTNTKDEFDKLTQRLPILQAELQGYKELREGLMKVVKEQHDKVDPVDDKAMAKKAKYLKELKDLTDKYRLTLIDLHREEMDGIKINEKELEGLEDRLEAMQGMRLGVVLDPSVDDDEVADHLFVDPKREQEIRDARDRDVNDLRDKEQQKNEILMESFGFAVGLINTLQEIQNQKNQDEITALDNKREYELSLAGDNAEAKTRINRDFDERERALKTKQAQRNKEQALFDIGINTASAVIEALPNYALSLLVAAAGLVQAGIVASKPVPKFARGIFDLQGPGTETSDSITAQLSAHETVVPARGTRNFPDLLEHIVSNPNASYGDLANIVNKHIPVHLRGDLFKTKKDSGQDKLMRDVLRELQEVKKTIERKKEAHLNIDKNGFQTWTREGENWTKYVDNRYKW